MKNMWRCFKCLLLCVLAIAGNLPESSARMLRREDCGRGLLLIDEYCNNPCEGEDDPFPKLLGVDLPLTVAKVRDYITSYCNFAMPEIRKCFARNIRECSNSEQQYLNNLARHTSTICKSNSLHISPWLNYVLTKLTDEDVQANPSCGDRSDNSIHMSCQDEARNASGIVNLDIAYLRHASMEELLPFLQSFFRTQLECTMERFRDDPNRCSDWRLNALEFALPLTNPPYLGAQLNFTEAQIREMFEFPDRRRSNNLFPFFA